MKRKINGEDSINATDSELPQDLKLDDEVRLDKIKFNDLENDLEGQTLTLLDQVVLINAFGLKKRSRPIDELSQEELKPYLDAILNSEQSCWIINASALLFR